MATFIEPLTFAVRFAVEVEQRRIVIAAKAKVPLNH